MMELKSTCECLVTKYAVIVHIHVKTLKTVHVSTKIVDSCAYWLVLLKAGYRVPGSMEAHRHKNWSLVTNLPVDGPKGKHCLRNAHFNLLPSEVIIMVLFKPQTPSYLCCGHKALVDKTRMREFRSRSPLYQKN